MKTKRFILKQLRQLTFKAVVLGSSVATAAIPPMAFSPLHHETPKEINLQRWAQLELMFQNETSFRVEDYVPVDKLHHDMTSSDLAETILKESMDRFMDQYKDDATLRAIDQAVKGFDGDLQFGSAKSGSIHKLKLKLNPLVAQTQLTYSGVTNGEISYDIDDKVLKIEVSNKVGETTIVASHIDQNGVRSDTLGLRWNF